MATVGVYAPTGRFNIGATDNTGYGMWATELGVGATAYPETTKQLTAATYATLDLPVSFIEGTSRRAGDLLTLEGGIGHTLIKGYGAIGAVYYAQWKITDDHNLFALVPDGFFQRDYYFGIGPEVTAPIPLIKTMPFFLTVRYFFEVGNRVATQGNSLYVIFSVARPSPPPPKQ